MRGDGARRPRLHDVPAGMLMLRRPTACAAAPIRGGIEPPGPEPGSPYMTSVPFVRLIVCAPVSWQLLLNVEPPVKLIVSATICVHCEPVELPPAYETWLFGKSIATV